MRLNFADGFQRIIWIFHRLILDKHHGVAAVCTEKDLSDAIRQNIDRNRDVRDRVDPDHRANALNLLDLLLESRNVLCHRVFSNYNGDAGGMKYLVQNLLTLDCRQIIRKIG